MDSVRGGGEEGSAARKLALPGTFSFVEARLVSGRNIGNLSLMLQAALAGSHVLASRELIETPAEREGKETDVIKSSCMRELENSIPVSHPVFSSRSSIALPHPREV